jgi:hypothetical protein
MNTDQNLTNGTIMLNHVEQLTTSLLIFSRGNYILKMGNNSATILALPVQSKGQFWSRS